jgi:hypothetical protein
MVSKLSIVIIELCTSELVSSTTLHAWVMLIYGFNCSFTVTIEGLVSTADLLARLGVISCRSQAGEQNRMTIEIKSKESR